MKKKTIEFYGHSCAYASYEVLDDIAHNSKDKDLANCAKTEISEAENPTGPEFNEGRPTLEPDTSIDKGVWECIHPCAMVAFLLAGKGSTISESEMTRTLDAWGWLNEDGLPDVEKAYRESARWSLASK